MEEKIKISAVSYLNSKPFLYGLFRNDFDKEFSISLDYPSECARKLLSDEVDLGLVPVAIIPKLKNPHVFSDYCIGADGPVKTVCLFSDMPIENVEEIYLDYQSRTSVLLLKILLKEYWNLNPKLSDAPKDYLSKIGKKTAGLVIGDRTIGMEQRFAFVYDLADTWKKFSGLPFVFAAWVSNKKLPDSFIAGFNTAISDGIMRIEQVAQLFQSSHLNFDVLEYYQRYISYSFDTAKKDGLELFLQKAKLFI
jgi:chorismate dehydratase